MERVSFTVLLPLGFPSDATPTGWGEVKAPTLCTQGYQQKAALGVFQPKVGCFLPSLLPLLAFGTHWLGVGGWNRDPVVC